MAKPESLSRRFLLRLAPDSGIAALFESLPGIYFYAKDAEGRLMRANRALVALRGFATEQELIGLSDFDLHPRHLAERYVAEDRTVFKSGHPLADQVWLIPGRNGSLNWYLSTKVPLFDPRGRVIGIAGMFRDLRKFETAYQPDRAMDIALRRVLETYPERIEVADLAASIGLSISQFDRRFKGLLGMTPREYILRVRVDAAAHALVATRRTAARIAADCGFYDQSSFGKQFRARTGMTPLEYRRRYTTETPGAADHRVFEADHFTGGRAISVP